MSQEQPKLTSSGDETGIPSLANPLSEMISQMLEDAAASDAFDDASLQPLHDLASKDGFTKVEKIIDTFRKGVGDNS